ncbi:uncharacterized protein [Heterodontus francisci]|uniref:uncharacterized protein n=1 Tax=Heterodontus francisci TaxID=7792 RepID=UPI00355C8747
MNSANKTRKCKEYTAGKTPTHQSLRGFLENLLGANGMLNCSVLQEKERKCRCLWPGNTLQHPSHIALEKVVASTPVVFCFWRKEHSAEQAFHHNACSDKCDMYLKNYRQCPCPVGRSSHSKEMELIYRRCLQSEPEADDQSPRSQSLPRVHDQRQQEKHIPHRKPSNDESGKEQANEVHQKGVGSVIYSNQHERKDICSSNDPVKAGKSKVHQSPREGLWSLCSMPHPDGAKRKIYKADTRTETGLSYDERLNKLGIHSLELRIMRGDLIETYKILKGLDRGRHKEHLTHDGKKLCPPENPVKFCNDSSHKNRESIGVKPLASRSSEQDNSKLLVPDAVPKDSSSLPGSSLPKKEEKTEIRVKKTLPQVIEKKAQGTGSTAQIPVRITPRVDGVGPRSGSFIVLRNDPLEIAPVVKTKSVESRSSEPPVKRKKTAQKMISTIPGKMTEGNAGADMQNVERRGEKVPCRKTSSDDEISDDDIFREIPEQYSDKATKRKEKTIVKLKGEHLSPNDASSKDNKKYSHRNTGNVKEVSRHHGRDHKSHCAPPTDCKVSKAAKDILAREPSGSNTVYQMDRPKSETHKDPRSALILAKRDKLMKTYRLDCETFAMVAKQLVNQDPSIEKQVQSALRKSLQLIGERCLEELKKSIAKYDAADTVKKSN